MNDLLGVFGVAATVIAIIVLVMPWLAELVSKYWEWCERVKDKWR